MIHKKNIIQFIHRTSLLRNFKSKEESGLALMMTLMLGVVLLAGVSGLLSRQLMSRRLSAKESYQQMAESAANNGLNRILGQLNNPDPELDRGFLFTLDNRENSADANNGFSWELLNTNQAPHFSEVCKDTSIGLPNHPTDEPGHIWPTSEVPLIYSDDSNMRDDGIAKIETFYRLRGYSSPGGSGRSDSGEAKFIIEGLVRRQGAPEETFLARSRLERSLYIQSWVDISRPNDWAILAANHFELGPVQLNSSGLILWHADPQLQNNLRSDCGESSLTSRLNGNDQNTANLATRIWPVVNKKQPPTTIFKIDDSKDTYPGKPGSLRIWRLDDENLMSENCRYRILCQREAKSSIYREPTGLDIRYRRRYVNGRRKLAATIRLREQDICANKTGDCHIYFDRLSLNHSELYIENNKRPVVIHLLGQAANHNLSEDEASLINLGRHARLCGVNKNSSRCNNQPERLIIATDAKHAPDQCNDIGNTINLVGNSLPAAWIIMRQGTVSLNGDTEMNGVIWSHSFCSNNHRLSLNASTSNHGGSHVIQQASSLWGWANKGFSGYGRRITRGIRGTGLDQFQRF